MISHACHAMHSHSLAAWRDAENQRHLSRRALAIYSWLVDHGPHTDRQIAEGLGFSDMNAVRPRVTELLRGTWLIEVGNTKDAVTGKTVRVVRAATDTEREGLRATQQELFMA